MFLHSDRPLISENRTSTLLHELGHIALGIRGDEESDWIVEGLAEHYSLETLRRSGGISEQRYKQAVKHLSRWAQRSATLFGPHSDGATTARAVMALRAADAEIRSATGGKASLDDVARKLASEGGTVSLARLQRAAQEVARTILCEVTTNIVPCGSSTRLPLSRTTTFCGFASASWRLLPSKDLRWPSSSVPL